MVGIGRVQICRISRWISHRHARSTCCRTTHCRIPTTRILKVHTCETATARECIISYTSHIFWYCDTCETATVIECTGSYAGHT